MSDQDKRDGFKDGVREERFITDIFTRAARGTEYNEGYEEGEAERTRLKAEKDINDK